MKYIVHNAYFIDKMFKCDSSDKKIVLTILHLKSHIKYI